jgi:threonine dehydrogenase-like Zn-dependent dehydrogenase
MLALRFDRELRLITDAPVPMLEGETLVRVSYAGICNTDLEITKGYAAFRGILGHEFMGVVARSPDPSMIGKRVVGEINAGCGQCPDCRSGDARHCRSRTVLGIKNRDGAFAEFLSLPTRNLIELPDSIGDVEAIFTEPLAAACHILDQVNISDKSRVAVVGDGKLAQLIVMVLGQTDCVLTVIGKHDSKLDLAARSGATVFKFKQLSSEASTYTAEIPAGLSAEQFDVVVEASGSAGGLSLAVALVRPRGVVVLKSTYHGLTELDASLIVVNEIAIVGSRCGRFSRAIELLSRGLIDVRPLVTRCMPLSDWSAAFAEAASPTAFKIILDMSSSKSP